MSARNARVHPSEAHRGWWVSNHVILRIIKRALLGAGDPAEVARWVREHAHEAVDTGQVTWRGHKVYRLAHPWPGPDFALVVVRDPDGTRAVTTGGWWEDVVAAE